MKIYKKQKNYKKRILNEVQNRIPTENNIAKKNTI